MKLQKYDVEFASRADEAFVLCSVVRSSVWRKRRTAFTYTLDRKNVSYGRNLIYRFTVQRYHHIQLIELKCTAVLENTRFDML